MHLQIWQSRLTRLTASRPPYNPKVLAHMSLGEVRTDVLKLFMEGSEDLPNESGTSQKNWWVPSVIRKLDTVYPPSKTDDSILELRCTG